LTIERSYNFTDGLNPARVGAKPSVIPAMQIRQFSEHAWNCYQYADIIYADIIYADIITGEHFSHQAEL